MLIIYNMQFVNIVHYTINGHKYEKLYTLASRYSVS